MAGLFDIASSGIQAYREALAVTGQNIANVDTEGYRRRGVALSEISASQNDITTISDQTGLGVRVSGITRAFDSFIANRTRDAGSDFSQTEAHKAGLDTLEGALVPGEYDLGYFLGEFFDGLNSLAQAPSDLASRTVALTKGSALAEGFVRLSKGLDTLRDEIAKQSAQVTRDLNSLLVTLRNTQNQLIASGSGNNASNAILDARDQTLTEIADLVGISVTTAASGAATVTLGRTGNGPLLGNAMQAGALQVQQLEDRLAFLAGQTGNFTETQQVTSGRLAGLSEAYGSITRAMQSLDALATRLATEFNRVHTNGLDLNGKVGGALFTADGVAIEQSPTNLGKFTASVSAPPVIDLSAAQTRFSYSAERKAWIGFDAAGKATVHPPGPITIGPLRINLSGTPADGDEFTLRAEIGSAAQMRFLLRQPQEFAAAGLLQSQADINNISRTTLDAAAVTPDAPTGLSDVTRLLRDDLSALAATTLRQDGVVGVIPAGLSSVDLVSMGRQDSVRFSLTQAQTRAAGTFSITLDPGGTAYDFTLEKPKADPNENAPPPWSDAGELAEWLNSGTLRSTANGGKSLADLGLFAAGSGGNLTIASAGGAGSIISAEITGPGQSTVTGAVLRGLDDVSHLQIFTRDGRQIAGTALSQSEIVGYLTEANGFLPETEYRADFLNGDKGLGYRGMEIGRRTTDGTQTVTLWNAGIEASPRLGDEAAVSGTGAGSMLLTIGGAAEVIDIPAGISAGLMAERINAVAADTGIRAEAATRLALSVSPEHEGIVRFTLVARNEAPVEIAANVTGGSLANLMTAINARSRDTGVVASLGAGLGRIVLVSEAGDDLVLGTITSTGGSFSATAVDATAALLGDTTTLGGDDGATALRLGGEITLRGSLPIAVTWQGDTAESRADPFTDGLMSRQIDPAGRWQDIAFHLTEGLDTSEAHPNGFAAVAAGTRLTLKLGDPDDPAPLSAELDSVTLSGLAPAAVAQAMAARLRELGTVPTLTGQAVSPPADGTSVQVLLGDQSYTLSMIDGEVAVSGPEAGRITAFFDDTGALQVAAMGGSLSGQILSLSPGTPDADAEAFGLDVAEAGLSGRAVTTPPAPDTFTLAVVIDGTETMLSFDWDGTAFSSNPPQDIDLEVAHSGTEIVARLVVPASSGIADVRLRPSDDARTIGLVSADAEITLGTAGLRIASTTDDPVQLSASASSLVAERLSLRGLPPEELIVIATGGGARRIAAAFGEMQSAPITPASIEVQVVDGASRRVEIIDRASGHSIATRTVGEDGQLMAYGMRFDLNGTFETGDRFYVEANRDGTGDGRNALVLFALSDRNQRTGLGGFGEEYFTLLANVGAETRAASIAESAAEARKTAAVELEAEYSGVNLDEEAARLLEQQQAYQALARVLRTAGDLLDTLLNAIS